MAQRYREEERRTHTSYTHCLVLCAFARHTKYRKPDIGDDNNDDDSDNRITIFALIIYINQ